jgi:hypothetical protein
MLRNEKCSIGGGRFLPLFFRFKRSRIKKTQIQIRRAFPIFSKYYWSHSREILFATCQPEEVNPEHISYQIYTP